MHHKKRVHQRTNEVNASVHEAGFDVLTHHIGVA
jgi:hypothetical protein